jgi:multidrug efflux pump subunit AcrA (membrane-fusion protein)
MKRWVVGLLVLVFVGGGLVGGWWWARSSPQQVSSFLRNGGLDAARADEFVAWLGGRTEEEAEPALVVSGSIEGEDVRIVSELGGRIAAVLADEGDRVVVGQAVVVLDSSLLEAGLVEAEALVLAAQANLQSVKAGAHPASIMAAQAAVGQALAERSAAESMWQDTIAILENPQQIEAQISESEAAADLARVRVEQAEAGIASAEAERDLYRSQGSMEEKWLYAIHSYLVEAAEASLAVAQAEVVSHEDTLAALMALRKNPLAIVSQVHLAEAQYRIAEAGVSVAEARLAELEAGPSVEEVVVAQAEVDQAVAALEALKAQVELMTLRSPLAGTVTNRAVHSGEAAVPGATLLTVANLAEVQLTVYLPEDELDEVYLGQHISVQVDSFPGRSFVGRVSFVSQQAEFTPKNVQTQKDRVNMVFAVKVRLDNSDGSLKPGMPADAVINR